VAFVETLWTLEPGVGTLPRVDPVARAVEQLMEPDCGHVEALVVVAGGETVAAHALRDRRVDQPAEVFSVTKSVLATAVLVAIVDGQIGLDTTLGELLGSRVPAARGAARVRDLLAMTGGARCGGLDDIDRVMELPGGWVDALLAEPQRHPPGEVFCYDNGAAHLLAAGLRSAVGEVAEFAGERVLGPAGVAAVEWPVDPEGVAWGFAGLRMSALDLARLGEAWRTDVWGLGSLLVEATTAHTAGGDPEWLPYGWLFWIDEVLGRQAFLAAGWAGQYVLVVPPAGLTLVITGAPERLTTAYGGDGLPVIRALAAEWLREANS
jgi:CubicO group peptidase (beta-lactamase class C family)